MFFLQDYVHAPQMYDLASVRHWVKQPILRMHLARQTGIHACLDGAFATIFECKLLLALNLGDEYWLHAKKVDLQAFADADEAPQHQVWSQHPAHCSK